MIKTLWFIGLLSIGLAVVGCDNQSQQDDFAEEASQAPSGFSETDEGGRVISVDENDWRTAPVYRGIVRVEPAYPNPVSQGFVSIPVVVSYGNSVRGGLVLRAYSSSGQLTTLAGIPEASDPGTYAFTFSPSILGRTGLVRLFIFDEGSEIVSYGDLMIR